MIHNTNQPKTPIYLGIFNETIGVINAKAEQFVDTEPTPTGYAYAASIGSRSEGVLIGHEVPYWYLAENRYGEPRIMEADCFFTKTKAAVEDSAILLADAELIDRGSATQSIKRVKLEKLQIVIMGELGLLAILQEHRHASYSQNKVVRTVVPATNILEQLIDIEAVSNEGYDPHDMLVDFEEQLEAHHYFGEAAREQSHDLAPKRTWRHTLRRAITKEREKPPITIKDFS